MKIQKTVKARIFALTKIKEAMLREEYDNFQATLRGKEVPLYSATRQQAERLLRRIIKQNGGSLKDKDYSMMLRRDVFNIKKTDNKLAKFWVKIPVHHVRGGIKVPIQIPYNQEKLLALSIREGALSIREGKLLWKGDHPTSVVESVNLGK